MVYLATVGVHDGVALHSVKLASTATLFEVLDEVAAAMRRANHQVEMCYEAPWSAKVSSKKVPQYVSNEAELKEFWMSYARYKKKMKGNEVDGIMFRNMKDLQVCFVFYFIITPSQQCHAADSKTWKGERSSRLSGARRQYSQTCHNPYPSVDPQSYGLA